jgi:hypothetical protein
MCILLVFHKVYSRQKRATHWGSKKHEAWRTFQGLGVVLCNGIPHSDKMWSMQYETWWDMFHGYRTRPIFCFSFIDISQEKCIITSSLHLPKAEFTSSGSVVVRSLLIYIKTFNNNSNINNNNNNNNSIPFFILTCWLNSYKTQLQSQHKKIKYIQSTEGNKKVETKLS